MLRLGADDVPIAVDYYQHGCAPTTLAWWDAPKAYSRLPSVFAARGAHASYPVASTSTPPCTSSGLPQGWMDRPAGDGAVWPLSSVELRDVRDQPWCGFGGGWGEVGETSFGTGPVGPPWSTSTDPLTNSCNAMSWSPLVDPAFPQGPTVEQSAASGREVSVSASGFVPGEPVSVTLHSEPILLAELNADGRGRVVWSGRMPTSVQPGDHTIVVAAADGRGEASFPLPLSVETGSAGIDGPATAMESARRLPRG